MKTVLVTVALKVPDHVEPIELTAAVLRVLRAEVSMGVEHNHEVTLGDVGVGSMMNDKDITVSKMEVEG